MPNHVTNDITVTGPAQAIADLIAKVKGPNGPMDFNSILPMPTPLRDVCTGGTRIDGQLVRLWRETAGPNGARQLTAIPEAEQAQWRREFGATNWYDWATANWGTKWNAYDTSKWDRDVDDMATIRFTTAWASPEPVLTELSRQFPSLRFEVWASGEIDRPYGYRLEPRS